VLMMGTFLILAGLIVWLSVSCSSCCSRSLILSQTAKSIHLTYEKGENVCVVGGRQWMSVKNLQ
jgi:hypothetical protein